MSAWIRVTVVALVLVFPATGSGHWLRRRPATVAGYYYAVPVPVVASRAYYYSVPVPVVASYRAYYVVPTVFPAPEYVPAPIPQRVLYAQPTPAPPSGSRAPARPIVPTTKEPPRVSESSYGSNGSGTTD